MKLIENHIYIEFDELVKAGIKEDTLKKANLRGGSNHWQFIDDPQDKRCVLCRYDTLKDEHRAKVVARYGNPQEYMMKQPIKALVQYDLVAENYYLAYRYCPSVTDLGQLPLPTPVVIKYTWAASWLNMLREIETNKRAIKQLINGSIDDFYVHVGDLIAKEQIELPTGYRRLKEKANEYARLSKEDVKNGYNCLIHGNYGKRNAAKVKDEVSMAILLEMLSHHNQFDDAFVMVQYNKWAMQNKYEPITSECVATYRHAHDHKIMPYREGNAAFNSKYIPQVKGLRPSYPLALVEHDDNNLDLLFYELSAKKAINTRHGM